MNDTSLFEKAVEFAMHAHSGVFRRGKTIPYIVHPLEAALIVSTIAEDQELMAAAVLHDTVEDTSVTLEDIKREFGERVSTIVDILTDRYDPSHVALDPPIAWHMRKADSLDRISRAPREAQIVVLGDKLSNMRAIARDAEINGDYLWSTFRAGSRESLGWYYLGLAAALKGISDLPQYKEFEELTTKWFAEIS